MAAKRINATSLMMSASDPKRPRLLVTMAMTVGMIATIGGIALAAAFARDRFRGCLPRTESWRHRAGTVLEVGGSGMVLAFGIWTVFRSLPA
jgi:hypothetical protein